jgi:hypothetical protein
MVDRLDIGSEWYARRDGVVRGPFTVLVVSRYILLGRIRLDDELSEDRVSWQPARSVAELLPDKVRTLSSWADYQQLVVSRLQVDERRHERRKSRTGINDQPNDERRSGQDRRTEDGAHTIARLAYGDGHGSSVKKRLHRTGALIATLLLAVWAIVWFLPVSG